MIKVVSEKKVIANRVDDCVFVCLFVFVFLPVPRDYGITRLQHYTKDELFFQCRNIYLMVEGKVDGIIRGGCSMKC